MSDLEILKDILEASVEKNGEAPLTNRWLLNIVKLAQRKVEEQSIKDWEWLSMEDIF